jgi:predicted SAM-dependent methyltransferase
MKEIYKGMKLDIGAGNPAEGENQADSGYVLQDAEPHPGITLVCDIRDLDKHLEDNYVGIIRASHVLEHFHSKELTSHILPMLYKLLMPGGFLEIIVPNFYWHCTLVMAQHDERAVDMAFGAGKDKYDHHYTGWTPILATKWLTEAEFEIVDIYSADCIHIKAKKND